MSDQTLRWWELASYVVTVFGLPLALLTFLWQARRERQNERAEIYQRLSDEYVAFLKLLLRYPDLHLLSPSPNTKFAPEQDEQRLLIFGILVSLFERAFLLVYEDRMDSDTRRRWQSWEDYMREWCRRDDFRAALDYHLQGED